MTENIDTIIDNFKKDLLEIVKDELTKIDLRNSNLYNSVQVVGNSQAIQIDIDGYIFYVDKGRKAFTKRIPIKFLIRWVVKKGIRISGKNNIQVAYMIQNSIYKKGIRPRPIIGKINKKISELIKFQEKEVSTLLENILDKL